MTPPNTATGATPQRPEKNLPTRTTAMLEPRAGIRLKSEERVMPSSRGHLRPNFSDNGPNVRKPKMYPYFKVNMLEVPKEVESCIF
jgi:hypothetical protein